MRQRRLSTALSDTTETYAYAHSQLQDLHRRYGRRIPFSAIISS